MKLVAVTLTLLVSTPAFAQFGGLSGVMDHAAKVKKLTDIKISDAEERQIGDQVSAGLVDAFGVHQDEKVARYVALVGTALARASSRPDLSWEFVVLDTDGVNAFAAPGGIVHVTRGLLGLLKDEAELAGVLAHEIVHVTRKHTVNSIQKNSAVQFGADEVSASGGLTQSLSTKIARAAYSNVLNNKFDRNDENQADDEGVQLVSKIGYAPTGLSSALTKLMERNAGRQEASGLFASHPLMKDRLTNISKTIRDRKLTATATVQPRYASAISFDAKPIADVTMVPEGSRGLAAGEGEKKDATAEKKAEKKDEKKDEGRFGGLLSGLKRSAGTQSQNQQTVASGGARGVNPDRDAVGGSNKTRIKVSISPNDLAEFVKGIA